MTYGCLTSSNWAADLRVIRGLDRAARSGRSLPNGVGAMSQRVAVTGFGYTGFPMAAVLAKPAPPGGRVDLNPRRVEAVNRGESHRRASPRYARRGARRPGALQRPWPAPPPADIYVIAVPTPFRYGHHTDLSYIKAAADGVIPHLQSGEPTTLESTACPAPRSIRRPDHRGPNRADHQRPRLRNQRRQGPPPRPVAARPGDNRVGGLRPARRRPDRPVGYPGQEIRHHLLPGEILLTDASTAETVKLTGN